jgi:hypothetical protein
MNILECDEMAVIVAQAIREIEYLYDISDSHPYRSELEILKSKLEDTLYTLEQVL